MAKILENRNYDFTIQNIQLPLTLQEVMNSGFREEMDCILFKDTVYFGSVEVVSDFDKTSYEDFLNHLHTDSYISSVSDEFEYLKIGLEFSKQLYEKLKSLFDMNFRIIISFDETKYMEQEVDIFGSCVVRFYKIRESCYNQFKMEDLNEFQSDAVMIIE